MKDKPEIILPGNMSPEQAAAMAATRLATEGQAPDFSEAMKDVGLITGEPSSDEMESMDSTPKFTDQNGNPLLPKEVSTAATIPAVPDYKPPIMAHWEFCQAKMGIDQSKINPEVYEQMRSLFYTGALCFSIVCEQRGVDMTKVDDAVGEVVQFIQSQTPPT